LASRSSVEAIGEQVGGSFRDPSGFVFVRGGRVLRQVNRRYRQHYDQLMRSGLYDALTSQGLLVSHEELGPAAAAAPDAYQVLAPERIAVISYPYEWCFSQLREAALTTLRIQKIAFEHGMMLKDASAYNVQFQGSRPVFIDTLSFEKYEEGAPWIGYRQFCQHFLAPLALIAHVDVRLASLLRNNIDGIPLDLAARLLPAKTRLQPSLLMHIHLHAKSQERSADDGSKGEVERKKVGRLGLQGLIDSLYKAVESLSWAPKGDWANYYSATNYSDESFALKREIVSAFIDEARPESVWDLGANTGVFSRVASEKGINTTAIDFDPAAVEANFQQCRKDGTQNLLPLVGDLTNPSTGIGWAGEERESLEERGPAGLVMALALIHHLAIANNVPLEKAADYFSRLGESLIIEFVPKTDSQVQRMLRTREDIFDRYDQPGFEEAFERFFVIEKSQAVSGSSRRLYLMRRRCE
jgi:ribosomal protein L11 methylase PrmA